MQVEMPIFKLRQGNSALLVSMPHVGTYLPQWLLPRLTAEAQTVADTDWHLDQLYDFLDELDATVLVATHSRYVIDLNRPTDNTSLYPGQNTTGLCPVDNFEENPIYLPNQEPAAEEIQSRIEQYWRPYHDALASELNRLKAIHGRAMLWDAHSIQSVVPRFFNGELPHLNIGSADNQSCPASITEDIAQVAAASPYSSVVNGRFKGGYITRHYGKPAEDVYAVQLEIAMRSYMHESAPYLLNQELASKLRPTLRSMMLAMLAWSSSE